MWGALFGATLASRQLFPHPYTHLVHALWYLARGFTVEDPIPLHYDGTDIYPKHGWQVAFAVLSVAQTHTRLLDYTWLPLLLFCLMGYPFPLWMQILQTSFFAVYVHLAPQALCVIPTLLWKHVDMTPRSLWTAAALHGVLALVELQQQQQHNLHFLFLSVLAAECKYRMHARRYRDTFILWVVSLLSLVYERRLLVFVLTTLTSLGLGVWIHRWQYTDKVYNGNALYLSAALLVPILLQSLKSSEAK
jgi:hypothetical protein